VAARSKACTVFARSKAEIVGSNPIQGMDVCIVYVYSVFVLFCVQVKALRRADPRPRGLTDFVQDQETEEAVKVHKDCISIIIVIIIIQTSTCYYDGFLLMNAGFL
jgi:hypothetical protein